MIPFPAWARKLFDRGHSEVLIHAMGPCITKALHLTQDVLQHYGQRVTYEARHGTVEVVDATGIQTGDLWRSVEGLSKNGEIIDHQNLKSSDFIIS